MRDSESRGRTTRIFKLLSAYDLILRPAIAVMQWSVGLNTSYLELIHLYFPPSFHLTVGCFCPVGLSLLQQHFQQILWMLKSFSCQAKLLILEFKALMWGEVCILGHFVLR